MDAWTATINLGLATTIALIFVTEARIRERRHNTDRDKQTAWIQETFIETLDRTATALTAAAQVQAATLSALQVATDTNARFSLLLQHGVCPLITHAPTPRAPAPNQATDVLTTNSPQPAAPTPV